MIIPYRKEVPEGLQVANLLSESQFPEHFRNKLPNLMCSPRFATGPFLPLERTSEGLPGRPARA